MTSGLIIAIITMCVFLSMLLLGVPICVSMLFCGVVGCFFFFPTPVSALAFLSSTFVDKFTSYTISVAPMFMLMGEIASESGIGKNLFGAFQKILGRVPGGLACAVEGACTIFGAICGSAPATTALMSRAAYPEMKRHGYSDDISTGCISAGSSLAVLIPPSLILISYGVAAEVSIGKLFLGGIFVGLILMILFVAIILIWCSVKPGIAPSGERTTTKEKLKAIKDGSIIDVLAIFGFSMTGMFAGWFTATEAGAIGSILMLIDTIITKRFSLKMLTNALKNSLVMSGMIYCMITGATVLGKLFTLAQVPTMLGNFVTSLNMPGFVVVAVITLIFLVLGCFVDVMSIVLIVTPLFLPVLGTFGYDGIWFGVYCVVVSSLGAITPPVGTACYLCSGICDVEVQKTFKGALPFVLAFLIMVIVMAVFPQVVSYLPNKIM